MKRNTRQLLIETGAALVTKLGYNGAGLNMILKEANVPKGSFYYYFKSKEDFGLELIQFFGENFIKEMEAALSNSGSSRVALMNYFESQISRFEKKGKLSIFPLLKLATEVGCVESFRKELNLYFDKGAKLIRIALEKARIAGENDLVDKDAYVAAFLFDNWKGAVVNSFLSNDSDPLDRFVDYAFNWLLP